MKLGYNTEIADMKKLDGAGLDYFETAIAPIAGMSEDEFSNLKEFINSLKTPVEVFNVLLPGYVKALGPEYSAEKVKNYLETAFLRAKELGGQIIVFGSGGAKRIPDGFDREKAMEQLEDFVKILAQKAEKYGIIVPVEALRSAECNCINTLYEAQELSRKAESKNIVMLADWFHMCAENETADDMKKLGKSLKHVHIAMPDSRKVPYDGDGYDYTEFFTALCEMGYNERISFEGHSENSAEDCKKYLKFMRAHLEI